MDIKALRDLSYGVFILGTRDGKRLTGCVVNVAIQTSSTPPIIAVCVNRENFTNACIKASGGFSVSILSENAHGDLIGRFGFKSGKDIDKFDGIKYELTADNFPVVSEGIAGWLSCKVIDSKELATHTMFFGELTDAKQIGGAKAMTYAYYHNVIKGKSPEKAPTYQKEEDTKMEKKVWKCKVCGYVYDESEGAFESLPADWKCPICGVGKEDFELTEN
ncbi:MAG: flavin reductase [Elusimicrobiota bacterium]|jgi:flavin reductase (DIM6/NTAB) family NADH-FMN oxidoreductase RutF/rubredoxin|nr:flavin reductase [Elusimicrobiota bacterium]